MLKSGDSAQNRGHWEFIGPVVLAPESKVYVYGLRQLLSDLYLVEGLR